MRASSGSRVQQAKAINLDDRGRKRKPLPVIQEDHECLPSFESSPELKRHKLQVQILRHKKQQLQAVSSQARQATQGLDLQGPRILSGSSRGPLPIGQLRSLRKPSTALPSSSVAPRQACLMVPGMPHQLSPARLNPRNGSQTAKTIGALQTSKMTGQSRPPAVIHTMLPTGLPVQSHLEEYTGNGYPCSNGSRSPSILADLDGPQQDVTSAAGEAVSGFKIFNDGGLSSPPVGPVSLLSTPVVEGIAAYPITPPQGAEPRGARWSLAGQDRGGASAPGIQGTEAGWSAPSLPAARTPSGSSQSCTVQLQHAASAAAAAARLNDTPVLTLQGDGKLSPPASAHQPLAATPMHTQQGMDFMDIDLSTAGAMLYPESDPEAGHRLPCLSMPAFPGTSADGHPAAGDPLLHMSCSSPFNGLFEDQLAAEYGGLGQSLHEDAEGSFQLKAQATSRAAGSSAKPLPAAEANNVPAGQASGLSAMISHPAEDDVRFSSIVAAACRTTQALALSRRNTPSPKQSRAGQPGIPIPLPAAAGPEVRPGRQGPGGPAGSALAVIPATEHGRFQMSEQSMQRQLSELQRCQAMTGNLPQLPQQLPQQLPSSGSQPLSMGSTPDWHLQELPNQRRNGCPSEQNQQRVQPQEPISLLALVGGEQPGHAHGPCPEHPNPQGPHSQAPDQQLAQGSSKQQAPHPQLCPPRTQQQQLDHAGEQQLAPGEWQQSQAVSMPCVGGARSSALTVRLAPTTTAGQQAAGSVPRARGPRTPVPPVCLVPEKAAGQQLQVQLGQHSQHAVGRAQAAAQNAAAQATNLGSPPRESCPAQPVVFAAKYGQSSTAQGLEASVLQARQQFLEVCSSPRSCNLLMNLF